MAILCFSDVLEKVGLDPADVKLIRHALTDRKFKECYDIGKVFEYTCHQKKGFSKGYSYWAVFISGVGTLAKFYALYQVGPSVPDTADMVPQGIPDSEAKEYRGENAVFQLKPVDILSEYKPKGVVHCFSGSAETAEEILKLGMYIGLGGAVTFKSAKKPVEVAREVPADRLLIETDAPYMTPVPFRGKRNDSSLIPFTAEKIAAVRSASAQDILDLTASNAKELFKIQ